MKKSGVMIAFVFGIFLLASMVSAVEINMKDSYKPSETMIVKIDGEFLSSLTKNNIYFYRENHVAVPIAKEVASMDGSYYMYAVLPSDIRDYTMTIENVRYALANGQSSTDTIEKKFSVSGNESADFTINPGFMITSKDFNIQLKNNRESSTSVSLGFNGNSQSYSLKIGETKVVTISIIGVSQAGTMILTASSGGTSYSVPVQVIPNNTNNVPSGALLKFSVDSLDREIKVNETKIIEVDLYNLGDGNVTNARFSYPNDFSNVLNVTPMNFNVIEGNSLKRIIFTFFSAKESSYDGYFNLTSDQGNSSFLMDIVFLENANSTNENDSNGLNRTCYELNGKICLNTESCDSQEIIISDGTRCCFSNCIVASGCPTGQVQCSDGICKADCGSSSSFPWKTILGWILVIGVVGFLAWFFYFKNRKPKVNVLKEEVRKIEKK